MNKKQQKHGIYTCLNDPRLPPAILINYLNLARNSHEVTIKKLYVEHLRITIHFRKSKKEGKKVGTSSSSPR